jgi:hypothetical protein
MGERLPAPKALEHVPTQHVAVGALVLLNPDKNHRVRRTFAAAEGVPLPPGDLSLNEVHSENSPDLKQIRIAMTEKRIESSRVNRNQPHPQGNRIWTQGIVTLAANGGVIAVEVTVRKASFPDLDTRLLLPNPKGARAEAPVTGCCHQVTPGVEMTIDDTVRR